MSCCQVFPCTVYIDSSIHDTSDMSGGLVALSKCSIVTFITITLVI
jgi:hypothetical protein